MLKKVTGAQLDELKAFYQLEPYGTAHEDLRHGITQSLIFNAHRDSKRERARKPEDFYETLKRPKEADHTRTKQGQHMIARMFASAFKAQAKRGKVKAREK